MSASLRRTIELRPLHRKDPERSALLDEHDPPGGPVGDGRNDGAGTVEQHAEDPEADRRRTHEAGSQAEDAARLARNMVLAIEACAHQPARAGIVPRVERAEEGSRDGGSPRFA